MSETKKYQNKEWLKEQYIPLNRKVIDIAEECKVTSKTINYWLRKFNFSKRKNGDLSRRSNEYLKNNNNINWKGNNVGYHCLHRWIQRHKPNSGRCENCGKKKEYLELANISGEYRRDINDYKYLCVKCHKLFDHNLKKLIKSGENTRFKKGNIPWNKGLPSEQQPNFGRKLSIESIEKMRKARKEYWEKRKTNEKNNNSNIMQKTIEVYTD